MNTPAQYHQLIKPRWAPPAKVFGPVWSFLYTLIAISYGYVVYLSFAEGLPFLVLLPFILNLIFNALYTPIQFGLHSNILAAIDILLVLSTLVWLLIAIHPYAAWVTWLNIPYLLWVAFATVLQLTITYLNRAKK